MQDEVREKSVAFVIRVGKTGGKLTASMLKYAIEQYLKQQRNPRAPHGKQSVKSLVRQGAGVQNIEITDKNIRSFQSAARKYGVDYALKKDTSSQPPRYLVFFKARDTDALTAAFREFSGKQLKRNKKPSILVQLKKFQGQIVNHDRAQNRTKNGIER
ncbi:MAG: PcfB family protein [Negativibacillus massiliensis]|uniref:PcfB family protein n=1 Tax=Negativibacillus massiliensis TaxID=1871035 RepID=UPI0039A32DE3